MTKKPALPISIVKWAIIWRSRNRLEGKREWIQWRDGSPQWLFFDTRREAENFIQNKYGYIRERKDLREEPHGWKMPKAVRVSISLRNVHEKRRTK